MKFNEVYESMVVEKKILSVKIANQFAIDIESLFDEKDIDSIVNEMLPDDELKMDYKSDLGTQIYKLIIKVGNEYTKKQANLK